MTDTSERGTGDATAARSERLAAWIFGASAVATIPLLALVLGDHHWFFADDWYFITERRLGSVDDLFRPHNGHWSTVPVVIFRLLWSAFGLRTYLPYQLVVIVLHVGVVVLLRLVMRRAGVGPWIASAAAGALLLFGSGGENAIWAFQMGFTGAILFGLGQLLLADHDGPVDRRDAGALVAGALAISSAGTGIPMVAATALALLARRGWRRAVLQSAPLAAIYGIWSVATTEATTPDEGDDSSGLPSLGTAVRLLRLVYSSTFEALGDHVVAAVVLAAVLVVGSGLVLAPAAGRLERVRRAAPPLSLAVGGLVFATLTVVARWGLGTSNAKAGRYLYVCAALLLPLLAVAADALARRWRLATPVLVVLLLVAVPTNIGRFDDGFFGPSYHESQRALATSVVRLPYAGEVSALARPLAGSFHPEGLDLRFLLRAARAGDLEPSTGPLPAAVADELEIRLSLVHLAQPALGGGCRPLGPDEDLRPVPGTVYRWDGPGAISVRPVREGGRAGPSIDLYPVAGEVLVAQRGAAFDWEHADPSQPVDLCELRPAEQPG